MIFQKSLNQIEISDINELINNRVAENIRLEYKKTLDLKNSYQKKEFLKDITGFANSEGGLIIYGVEENKDSSPKIITGINIQNPDEFERKITEIIHTNVEPTPFSWKNRLISLQKNDLYVFIISIPPNSGFPFQRKQQSSDFFLRHSKSIEPMSYNELKNKFLYPVTIIDKLIERTTKRSQILFKNLTSYPNNAPYVAFQIIPINDFRNHFKLDFQNIEEYSWTKISQTFFLKDCDFPIINLKGLTFRKKNEKGSDYCIFFRNGAFEWISNFPFQLFSNKWVFFIDRFRKMLVALFSTKNSLRSIFFDKNDIFPPFILKIDIIRAYHSFLQHSKNHDYNVEYYEKHYKIEENPVSIYPMIIVSLENENLTRILKQIDLLIWQIFNSRKVEIPWEFSLT